MDKLDVLFISSNNGKIQFVESDGGAIKVKEYVDKAINYINVGVLCEDINYTFNDSLISIDYRGAVLKDTFLNKEIILNSDVATFLVKLFKEFETI